MFKITKDHVTCWSSADGYGKREPSTAWCTFVDDLGGDCDVGMARAGYSRMTRTVSSDETDWLYDILLFAHDETGELAVVLDAGDGWVAGLFVDQMDADAFMFTEYLEMHERIGRITQHVRHRVSHRAQMAFIRHGHGTHTVSRDGQTLEDQQDERRRLREFQERSRPGV